MIRVAIAKRFAPGPESAAFELDVSFDANSGVNVLYGASGSGKTLTLDAIAGFVAPDSGRILLDERILFDGEARVNLPPRDRSCGYVFQNYALFPHMTLRQNLAFAAHRLPRLERRRRVAESLERFGLAELAGRYPREVSGGQKQRCSIARALIAQPRILLLDEPGQGLDSSLRESLRDAVRDIARSSKTPMMLVTHDLEECLSLADSVLIYDNGRIVRRGAPLDLVRNPGTAATARLLGGFNVFDAEVLALDPGRHTSRVRILGHELVGPHLPACFKGDRVALASRPEEMRIVAQPGENRLRVNAPVFTVERPQSIRADFGGNLVVDVPRDAWRDRNEELWVEIPPESLRLLAR
ncbi:MAG TPA: ABC transporter ATP-binding protein [Bryobacteraceae bacterium]|nr:ABC transporter ATP-binding protein [Bryobacteraceae bacterium]